MSKIVIVIDGSDAEQTLQKLEHLLSDFNPTVIIENDIHAIGIGVQHMHEVEEALVVYHASNKIVDKHIGVVCVDGFNNLSLADLPRDLPEELMRIKTYHPELISLSEFFLDEIEYLINQIRLQILLCKCFIVIIHDCFIFDKRDHLLIKMCPPRAPPNIEFIN